MEQGATQPLHWQGLWLHRPIASVICNTGDNSRHTVPRARTSAPLEVDKRAQQAAIFSIAMVRSPEGRAPGLREQAMTVASSSGLIRIGNDGRGVPARARDAHHGRCAAEVQGQRVRRDTRGGRVFLGDGAGSKLLGARATV